jgi:hypothetical protein
VSDKTAMRIFYGVLVVAALLVLYIALSRVGVV